MRIDTLALRFRLWAFVGLVLSASIVWVPAAYSHRPRLPEGNNTPARAYRIEDPEISWALYADLETDGRVEYYRFRLEKAGKIAPELLVPDESAFDDFQPRFVVYGAFATGETAPAGIALPAGTSALRAKAMNEDEFESFTRKSFRKVATFEDELPAGEYGIAVYEPNQKTGEYVLVIGKEEKFDGSDIAPLVRGCGTIFF